jgi:hypothetical protein
MKTLLDKNFLKRNMQRFETIERGQNLINSYLTQSRKSLENLKILLK